MVKRRIQIVQIWRQCFKENQCTEKREEKAISLEWNYTHSLSLSENGSRGS
jgi:hypothetical protein